MSDFYHLAGKAMFDPKFAEDLKKNPEKALRDIGIEPTEEMLKALNEVDTESLGKVAEAFGSEGGVEG